MTDATDEEIPAGRTMTEVRRAPIVVQDDVSFLFDTARFEQLQRVAQLMAGCDTMPDHLKHKMPDCFRVASQATRWQMDPFAICDKTYSVAGKLAYEGQLIAAVINLRAGLEHRLEYRYEGENKERAVIVAGKFRGETEERTVRVTLAFGVAQAKGAKALWESQPDQQLVYLGARVWGRRHCPEIILGAYTPEELMEETPGDRARDITPKTGLERFEETHLPFTLATVDGEIITVGTAEEAIALHRDYLDAAEKLGSAALRTLHDANGEFFTRLEQRGFAEVSKELSREYGRRRQAAEAREAEAKKAEAKQPKQSKSAAKPSGDLLNNKPRRPIWQDESYKIDPPIINGDHPDWKNWIDGLLFLIEEATPAERTKLRKDNEPHLKQLFLQSGELYVQIDTALRG